jgi:hypothetical protein
MAAFLLWCRYPPNILLFSILAGLPLVVGHRGLAGGTGLLLELARLELGRGLRLLPASSSP